MKKFVFSILAISSMAFGQIEKDPGDFNKLTSFDQIDILLIPATENSVLINGSRAEGVELVNKNGELKIRMKFLEMLDGGSISATVYYKELVAVEANEGSRIASNDSIVASSFDIIAKEGSQVKLKLNVDKLNVRSANGSKVELSGSASNQDILVNSGGIYKAESLVTAQTVISCNAGGIASVFATDLVDAKVRAGGSIIIYGKPKKINSKVVAGGTIKEAK